MRFKMLAAMAILAIPCAAFAAQVSLHPGVNLFSGKLTTLEVVSAPADKGGPLPGVLLPSGAVLKADARLSRPYSIGRPFTVRGRTFTPVMLEAGVESLTVKSPVPPATAGDWPTFPKKLAIITNSYYPPQLRNLTPFMNVKKADGWDVMLVTEETWNPANAKGQAAADALRGWLKDNYLTEGIGYVLLAGNSDPNYGMVPMKMVWPLRELCDVTQDPVMCDIQNMPTDAYFSDLDGDWDLDNDGLYGEYPDDCGEGGVDLGPEVIVGRFPVLWDPTILDAYFGLATMYETATDLKGRNRVLLPGAMLGFNGLSQGMENEDGAPALNAMGGHLAQLDPNLVFTRMFEQEGYFKSKEPTDYPLSFEHLVNAFKYGHGLTIWYGHGYPTYVERMIWEDDSDGNRICEYNELAEKMMMDSFETSKFYDFGSQTMLWQISCMNAYPELEYNMAAMMLISNAAGTVAATRSALGEYAPNLSWAPDPGLAASETLAYYWAEQLQKGMPIGEALAYVKATIPSDGWDEAYPPSESYPSMMGLGYHSKFVYNLYGDPTLVWKYEAGAHDPDWPWADTDDDSSDDDSSADDDSSSHDSGGHHHSGCSGS